MACRESLTRILNLPNGVNFAYTRHKDLMKSEDINIPENAYFVLLLKWLTSSEGQQPTMRRFNSDRRSENDYSLRRGNSNHSNWRKQNYKEMGSNNGESQENNNENKVSKYNKLNSDKIHIKTENKFKMFELSSSEEEDEEKESSNEKESASEETEVNEEKKETNVDEQQTETESS